MKKSTKIKAGIGVVIILIIGLFLHHYLPRTAVVQLSGTDVKRQDRTTKVAEPRTQEEALNTLKKATQDVRFINSVSRDGKTMVFRKEDTG